jgi:hypothetical protein
MISPTSSPAATFPPAISAPPSAASSPPPLKVTSNPGPPLDSLTSAKSWSRPSTSPKTNTSTLSAPKVGAMLSDVPSIPTPTTSTASPTRIHPNPPLLARHPHRSRLHPRRPILPPKPPLHLRDRIPPLPPSLLPNQTLFPRLPCTQSPFQSPHHRLSHLKRHARPRPTEPHQDRVRALIRKLPPPLQTRLSPPAYPPRPLPRPQPIAHRTFAASASPPTGTCSSPLNPSLAADADMSRRALCPYSLPKQPQ